MGKARDMNHVSESLREVLAGCGMHDRTVGAGKVMGMDAGVPKGSRTHPLTAQAGEEDTASRYVNGKRTPGEPAPVNREDRRQSRPEGDRVGFNYVVHTNHAVPTSTRKTAGRRTSAAFLMVVK
jgi:hypothetical protein